MCLQPITGQKRKSPVALAGRKRKSSAVMQALPQLESQKRKSISAMVLQPSLESEVPALSLSPPPSFPFASLSPDVAGDRDSGTIFDFLTNNVKENQSEQANGTDSTNQISPIGSVSSSGPSSLEDRSLIDDLANCELGDADTEAIEPMGLTLGDQH